MDMNTRLSRKAQSEATILSGNFDQAVREHASLLALSSGKEFADEADVREAYRLVLLKLAEKHKERVRVMENSRINKVPITSVSTVGQLRELLKDLSADEVIHWQVAAQDGSAWSMGADWGTALHGTIFCCVLRHPELKTLKFGGEGPAKILEALRKVRDAVGELDLRG
jgi:hypothetical protein